MHSRIYLLKLKQIIVQILHVSVRVIDFAALNKKETFTCANMILKTIIPLTVLMDFSKMMHVYIFYRMDLLVGLNTSYLKWVILDYPYQQDFSIQTCTI